MYVKGVKGVNTINKGSKAMLKVLKVVFAAFMQHCIQSTHLIGHMSKLLNVYSAYRAPCPSKREGLL